MKLLLLIIFSTLIISCAKEKEENTITFGKFPEEVFLSHEEIKVTPNLYFVGGLILMDSILLTIDVKADTFFQAFKLPDYNHIGGYITKGNGPNEEILIDPYIQHISGNSFLYKNISSVKVIEFDVSSNKMELIKKIDLPEELMDLWHIFKLENDLIGSNPYNETKKEFIAYDMNSEKERDFGPDFPNVEKEIEPHFRNMLFAKATTVRATGDFFASVYDKFPILRIYTKKGNIHKEVRFENKQVFPNALIQENPSESAINEITQNYRKIKSTNEFIYALYIGKAEKDIKEASGNFSNEIHVWDWDGNPIKRIKLDNDIFSFDVDSFDRFLICSSVNSLDTFYKYNLN